MTVSVLFPLLLLDIDSGAGVEELVGSGVEGFPGLKYSYIEYNPSDT